MQTGPFKSFAEMIDNISAKAIPKAIELEQQMLEDDLLHERISSAREAASILSFCRFITALIQGENVSSGALPAVHIVFYRKIVARLIEARELPFNAKEQFDATFSSGLLKAWT